MFLDCGDTLVAKLFSRFIFGLCTALARQTRLIFFRGIHSTCAPCAFLRVVSLGTAAPPYYIRALRQTSPTFLAVIPYCSRGRAPDSRWWNLCTLSSVLMALRPVIKLGFRFTVMLLPAFLCLHPYTFALFPWPCPGMEDFCAKLYLHLPMMDVTKELSSCSVFSHKILVGLRLKKINNKKIWVGDSGTLLLQGGLRVIYIAIYDYI